MEELVKKIYQIDFRLNNDSVLSFEIDQKSIAK